MTMQRDVFLTESMSVCLVERPHRARVDDFGADAHPFEQFRCRPSAVWTMLLVAMIVDVAPFRFTSATPSGMT